MMIQEKLVLIPDRPILQQILKHLGLTYAQFADRLEVGLTTLEHYRRGSRQFKLSMKQLRILRTLLEEIGLKIEELPDDWILDKPLE